MSGGLDEYFNTFASNDNRNKPRYLFISAGKYTNNPFFLFSLRRDNYKYYSRLMSTFSCKRDRQQTKMNTNVSKKVRIESIIIQFFELY